jgi:hypothetical protein
MLDFFRPPVTSTDSAVYSFSMATFLRTIESKLVDIFERSGFVKILGGRDEMETGLRDLRAGVLPVLAELLQAQERGHSLAKAVLNGETYPHLTRFHGWFVDFLDMPMPEEFAEWVGRLLDLGPALDDPDLHRLLAVVAFRSPLPAERALGRLLLFEILCLGQRVHLLTSKAEISVLTDREDSIEEIAESELAEVENRDEYRHALLELEDPMGTLRVLLGASLKSLTLYMGILKTELTRIGSELAQRLNVRQEIYLALARLDPTDALLIRNEAGLIGGERLTVEQLRVRHPGLLGGVAAPAARKRLERARRRRLDEPNAGKPKTFGDLLLAHLKDLEG